MLWDSVVMKKGGAGSWQQQRISGWFREVVVKGGCWGEVELDFAWAVLSGR